MAAVLDTLYNFFSGLFKPDVRAQRMMILHVFFLVIITFIQLGITVTYINDKADIDMLSQTALNVTADWTTDGAKNVLKAVFPKLTTLPDKTTGVPELKSYVQMTCLPLWRTVREEQMVFRWFLWAFAIYYAIYSVRWLSIVFMARRNKTKLEGAAQAFDFYFETTTWWVTQIVEVVFIVYAFLGFFHRYTNEYTPESFNEGRKAMIDAAVTTNYHMTEHCFALDQVLGADLWGKHTPWAADKLMMDQVIGTTIFALAAIRYLMTAALLYPKEGQPPTPPEFGGGANIPGYATGYPPMYNVVAMR